MRKLTRAIAALGLTVVASATAARADTFPDRPVKIIVAFSAGGTLDTFTRIVADRLGEKWKQAVVVDNRVGASGNIGATLAARATPDGYTLHMSGSPLTANVALTPDTSIDPIKEFEPVALLAWARDVLMVSAKSPYHSVKDLVDAARAAPGKLTFSSLGVGSAGHVSSVLFENKTGIRAQHVPYTNVGQMQVDMGEGRVSFWITSLGAQLGVIKGGAIRALAVSGKGRASELPDVPTFEEEGVPMVDPSTWFALFAPKGIPADVVSRINADVNAVLAAPDLVKRLDDLGFTIDTGAPDKLARLLPADIATWREVAESPAYKTK